MSDEQIKEEDECHQRMTQASLKQKGYTRVQVPHLKERLDAFMATKGCVPLEIEPSESSDSSDSEDDTEEESIVAIDWWELDRKRKEEELLAKRIEGKVKEGTEEPAPAPQPSKSISVKGLENLIALAQGKPEPHVTFPEEPPLPPVEVVPLVVARPRALVADARGVKRWVRIKQSGRAKNA